MTQVHVGDLVEVLADAPDAKFWYGEVLQAEPCIVNYITKDKHDTWRFDSDGYEVDVECINHVVRVPSKKHRARAWDELGFVYRGDHEIIHHDDIDSDEEDDDWTPGDEEEEEDDADEDSDDSGASDDDEPMENDADYDDDLTDTDGETDPGSEEEEEVPPPKAKRSRQKK